MIKIQSVPENKSVIMVKSTARFFSSSILVFLRMETVIMYKLSFVVQKGLEIYKRVRVCFNLVRLGVVLVRVWPWMSRNLIYYAWVENSETITHTHYYYVGMYIENEIDTRVTHDVL